MKTTEPEVRKFLTVSSSHLPSGFAERLDDQARHGRGFQDRELCLWPFVGEYGFLVYAPSERAEDRDIPDSITRLLDYAREALGCSFVLFDVDGDVLDGFAIYEDAASRSALIPWSIAPAPRALGAAPPRLSSPR